jgi:hypothetical protein
MSESVRVPVGECRCPAKPHDEDWVDIEPTLNLRIGAAALMAMQQSQADGEEAVFAAILNAYLSTAIRAWSFVDEKRDAVPNTKDNRDRLLPFHAGALIVANRCDDLYSKELLGPFLAQTTSKSSPTGPTDGSTSARSGSGPTPRRRSKGSSPNGTAGMEYVAPVP